MSFYTCILRFFGYNHYKITVREVTVVVTLVATSKCHYASANNNCLERLVCDDLLCVELQIR